MNVTLLFFIVSEKSQLENLRVLEITGKLVKSAVSKVFLFYAGGRCWTWQGRKATVGGWMGGCCSLASLPGAGGSQGEPSLPAAPGSDGFLTFSVSSRDLFPWLTEEVPAQQYLEIDEVTTESFRVTWHPLSADEGQHKLMWIPVYGGKTEEVSRVKQPEN